MADRYDPTAGLFGISVAAGMVDPQRTPGGTRLYSMDDITRLRQIAALLDEGLNLVGIAMVLRLEADNARLRHEISEQRDHRRRK